MVRDDFSFPITVDFIFPVPTARFGFTVATTQNYRTNQQTSLDGFVAQSTSVSNLVRASDVSPASNSQRYTVSGSDDASYNCRIAECEERADRRQSWM